MAESHVEAARHYAEAAFQLAKADQKLERWLEDLHTAATALQDERVSRLLASPAISEEDKFAAARRGLSGIEPMALNLILLLIRRRRIALLPQIVAEFSRLANEYRGIVIAEVTSAVRLDEQRQRQVTQRLASLLGKTVKLRTRVDPSIIGGLVVRVGDTIIDGSVAGRLASLRRELA